MSESSASLQLVTDMWLEEPRSEPEPALSPEHMAEAIREGRWPSDLQFDRYMEVELRIASARYWSQLAVAARAAQWFEDLGIRSVADIGAGAGKFCVATALATDCSFVGVEQRPRLVSAARALASRFGVEDRVQFEHATFGDGRAPAADVYYLYNPFGENLFGYRDHLDAEVELSAHRYLQDIRAVENMLRCAPLGTHLLAYNGFGGRVPSSYSVVASDHTLPSMLRMWRKQTLVDDGPGQYAGDD